MLDAVDHLDALVERLPGRRVEREPDAFHRRDRDDAVRLAADLAGVDERRLRDVVRPLVAGEQLLPPLHPAGRQVDGDQRVGARVRPGPQAREVERRRRAGAEVDRVRCRVDRGRASRPPRRRRFARRAATTGSRAEPSRTALGQAGFRSVVYAITKPRIPYSEPAAPTITRLFAQIGALVSE